MESASLQTDSSYLDTIRRHHRHIVAPLNNTVEAPFSHPKRFHYMVVSSHMRVMDHTLLDCWCTGECEVTHLGHSCSEDIGGPNVDKLRA